MHEYIKCNILDRFQHEKNNNEYTHTQKRELTVNLRKKRAVHGGPTLSNRKKGKNYKAGEKEVADFLQGSQVASTQEATIR